MTLREESAFALDDPEGWAARVLTAFRSCWQARVPMAADADLAAEIALEARPAMHALLHAATNERVDDLASLEHHETLAMVTLLGRRVGILGASPTAMLTVVPSLLESARAQGLELAGSIDEALTTAFAEGYVRGREERLHADHAERALAAAPIVPIAPGCLALVASGDHDPDTLEALVEAFGRRLLNEDARACIVDLSTLTGTSRAHAAAILSADATAKMLGVRCVFSSASPELRVAATHITDHASLEFANDFAEALTLVLPTCGLTLTRRGLRGLLERARR